jgi:methylenetetrahydrofolate dehydrogenase (NADP+)/methenyltetrahydrofolate cyclohydrolase
MLVLDGKLAAAAVKEVLKAETAELVKKGKPAPHLAAILVGNNGASETYVASKVKNCEETGFESTLIRLPVDTTESVLLETIQSLNNNS